MVMRRDLFLAFPDRSNDIDIPPQGLAMLRLFPLEPWHAGGGYSALESVSDKEIKE